jgi:hypothetical protein
MASAAGGTAQVTNSNDAGAGSFRAAIDKANADPSIGRIVFRHGLGPIVLAQPVVYVGGQSLDIFGNGSVLDGGGLAPGAADAFLANGGGNLSVAGLTVQNAPQQGLTYQVPADATGTKKVRLIGVQILGNDGHGVLIDDQVDPTDTTNPNGSAASIDVSVVGSRFAENGFAALDRDGLRVNEGGDGSLNAVISLTRFDHNGADGIELDERGLGDAVFNVSGTQITRNGSFDVTLADLDDGMDVDEGGDGALIGMVLASAANDNFEEGWDFNENDAGDFKVDMTLVEASRNGEEGVDFEEDDDFAGGGDLITTLIGVKADGNAGGDAGLKIREKGLGNLNAAVRGAQANGNQTDGINVREDAAGNLTATVERSTTGGNAGDGTHFDERSTGNLTATASRGNSSNNTLAGVRADQQLSAGDVGTLNLVAMTLDGNGGGRVIANGVTVTQTP